MKLTPATEHSSSTDNNKTEDQFDSNPATIKDMDSINRTENRIDSFYMDTIKDIGIKTETDMIKDSNSSKEEKKDDQRNCIGNEDQIDSNMATINIVVSYQVPAQTNVVFNQYDTTMVKHTTIMLFRPIYQVHFNYGSLIYYHYDDHDGIIAVVLHTITSSMKSVTFKMRLFNYDEDNDNHITIAIMQQVVLFCYRDLKRMV